MTARACVLPMVSTSSSSTRKTQAMAYKNQVPNPSPRTKAAKRRDKIASVALFVVVLGCIVLTGAIWLLR